MKNKSMKEVAANPAAPEAERAVLGSAMIESWAARKLLQMVSESDFYDDRHQMIFQAIATAAEKHPNTATDVVMVKEELGRRTVNRGNKSVTALEAIGGGKLLGECIDAVGSAANVEQYAKYVKEASIERQIYFKIEKTAMDPSATQVKELGDLILSLQGLRGGTIFDMRSDLGLMVDAILEKPAIGTPTGFEQFDEATCGGPVAEELITISARPGDGKTAVMLKMACNMAEQMALDGNPKDECILYLTTEMTVKSLVQRILPMVTGIPHSKFRTGSLTKPEQSQVINVCGGGLDTFPLKILGKSSLSIDDIKGAVYQAKPKVVFIDYLQRCKMGRADNMAYAIGDFMAQLKSFMVDCQIAGFIGCQSDRELDKAPDFPPTLSHLKGSGGIESESDMVLMLWRPSGKALQGRTDWVMPRPGCVAIEGIIRKARSGATGTPIGLQLEGALIKMTDRLPDVPARQGEF